MANISEDELHNTKISITDNDYVKISINLSLDNEIISFLLNKFKKLYLEFDAVTNENIKKIPSYVKDLVIDGNFDDDTITLNNLPQQLESLYIGCENSDFNKPLENLPSNLKYLYIYGKYNYPLDSLPFSLINLYIYGNFNQSLDNLPPNLEILEINNNSVIFDKIYNKKMDNLPINLKILKVNKQHTYKGTYEYLIEKHPKLIIYYE
jgi:hypothetical protein